jgi:hypothetical protein
MNEQFSSFIDGREDNIKMAPLKSIWLGLQGKISIILSGFNTEKLHMLSKYDEKEHAVILKAISELTENGPLTFGGDAYARDAILRILRSLYPKAQIETRYDQHIGCSLEECFCDSNVILIGGPISNFATDFIMKELGIREWFKGYCIVSPESHTKYEAKYIELEGKTYIVKDYGFIARYPNPFDERYSIFIVAGCRSFGTRAAGAAIAMGDSVAEIVDYLNSKDLPLNSFQIVVEISRENGNKPLEPDDSENEVRIVEPFEGLYHQNDKDIAKTETSLRNAISYLNSLMRTNNRRIFPVHRLWVCILSFIPLSFFVSSLLFGFLGKIIPACGIILSLLLVLDSMIRMIEWNQQTERTIKNQ